MDKVCSSENAQFSEAWVLWSVWPDVAEYYPKSRRIRFYFKKDIFHIEPNIWAKKIFGLLLQDNLSPRLLQNSPIWSHCLRLKSLERWQVGWYDSKVGRSCVCVCVSWIEQNHQIRYNHFFLMIGRTDWTDWIPLHHFAKLLHSPTYYLNECSVQCCHIEQNYFIWEKSMSRNAVPKDYLPR